MKDDILQKRIESGQTRYEPGKLEILCDRRKPVYKLIHTKKFTTKHPKTAKQRRKS